jgi:hypothetical protein
MPQPKPNGGHEPRDPRPGPHNPGPPPPFQAAAYTFSLVAMEIMNTRSVHEDSDKASLSVAVGDGAAQTVTKDLGDVNNGAYPIGLSIGPVEVSDPNVGIAFNYIILNSGHQDQATVDKILTAAGGALAAAGAKAATAAIGSAIGAEVGSAFFPVVGTILGAVAGWLAGEVMGLITADCDGLVACEQPAFKGIDLWNRTHTPSQAILHTTYHPGLDSPAGCGSNSQYNVTWSVTRS